MALTLLQYKDRVAKKGVPATGDADTQLKYCINYARRVVWYHYEWPFKRVVSSSFNVTSSTPTVSLSTIGSTLKTIKRIIDTTNGADIVITDLDNLLDIDPSLDDTSSSLSYWCWYSGSSILFWPTLTSGTTIACTAYGEKTLTELSADTDTDIDITDDDLVEFVVMIAHARALVENEEIIRKASEYKDAISGMSKLIRNNYENRTMDIGVPGWNIYTGHLRKKG